MNFICEMGASITFQIQRKSKSTENLFPKYLIGNNSVHLLNVSTTTNIQVHLNKLECRGKVHLFQ